MEDLLPLEIFNLDDFRRLTKDLPGETVIAIADTEQPMSFYEHNCNGIRFFPASLDAPPAIIMEAGQEVTEDHYLITREDAYLWNGIGTNLK